MGNFQRLREKVLTLHDKCEFSQDSLTFFGYVFTAEGISADLMKVQAIINFKPPANTSEIRSLLGMANYCSRFIPGYVTLTQPLRELTKKHAQWDWSQRHNDALQQLKAALTQAPVAAYFDPDKRTEISIDASPFGLGAILAKTDPNTGDKHVVAYASRSFTSVE